MINDPTCPFREGDRVEKVTGDYYFNGVVRAVFENGAGNIRLVVENDHGVLHIYNPKQLRHARSEENISADIVGKLLDTAQQWCRDGVPEKAIDVLKMLRSMLK
jgi:hypothetical protein